MNIIHPTDFLIFSFDREVSQSKVLFQCPPDKYRFFFTPLERGRWCVRMHQLITIYVDVYHTTRPPSFRALNSPHFVRIDILSIF